MTEVRCVAVGARRTSRQRRVLAAVASGSITSAEVARRAGVGPRTAVLVLLGLLDEGVVERVGLGAGSVWRLVKAS